jgi:hypothetical protein
MALLDLQGLETPGYGHGGHHHAGSTLTVLRCASQTPSKLSLLSGHSYDTGIAR